MSDDMYQRYNVIQRYGRVVPTIGEFPVTQTLHYDIVQGDVKTLHFEIKDTNGIPIDLTPYTIRMTAKFERDSAIIFQKTVEPWDKDNDLKNGKFVFKLNHEDTNHEPKEYVYNITVLSAEGGYKTPFAGTFTLIPTTYY